MKMTTTSETKSHFERLLSEIYARRPRENNKRVCIDCKCECECKNCGCTEFCVLDYQNLFI